MQWQGSAGKPVQCIPFRLSPGLSSGLGLCFCPCDMLIPLCLHSLLMLLLHWPHRVQLHAVRLRGLVRGACSIHEDGPVWRLTRLTGEKHTYGLPTPVPTAKHFSQLDDPLVLLVPHLVHVHGSAIEKAHHSKLSIGPQLPLVAHPVDVLLQAVLIILLHVCPREQVHPWNHDT